MRGREGGFPYGVAVLTYGLRGGSGELLRLLLLLLLPLKGLHISKLPSEQTKINERVNHLRLQTEVPKLGLYI